ncbi:MAG: hypothetical protein ACLQUY_15155, partial [Ktedonobacterales bacterium]
AGGRTISATPGSVDRFGTSMSRHVPRQEPRDRLGGTESAWTCRRLPVRYHNLEPAQSAVTMAFDVTDPLAGLRQHG